MYPEIVNSGFFVHRKQKQISPISYGLLNKYGLEIANAFACFKKVYPNSVIYLSTLGQRKGLPWKTKKKMLKVLTELVESGLATQNGDRIILIGKRDQDELFPTKSKKEQHFIKIQNKADIKLNLAYAVISSLHRRKVYRVAMTQSQQTPMKVYSNKQSAKVFKKEVKKLRGKGYGITSYSFSQALKTSTSKARRIMMELNKAGLIAVDSRKRMSTTLINIRFKWQQFIDFKKDWKHFLYCYGIISNPNMDYCYFYKGLIRYTPPSKILLMGTK